ncbi:tripartite tricarboxylate transporter permease [Treponema sp. HNW]|uniref:tripartite tricarboxylate transporter permease n=1 Tax=Treponema sp. HNW TaxID=3116654 RepID=UPI003D0F2CCE
MAELQAAFINVLTPSVMLFLFLGVTIGTVIGALPGLSATMGIAILTPVTFWFAPENGFAMLIGLWNAAIFAGGITAIILNTPGTPSSITQSFDGYPLYKQGKGGLALGINVIYSAIGGLISILCLIIFAFPIARFTVTFGPTEYFSLALLGLTMMITVSGKDILKGFLMGFTGLLISTIGLDPILSVKRYTLGQTDLLSGISFIPVMIGMFGLGEVLYQIFTRSKEKEAREAALKKENLALGRIFPTRNEFKAMAIPTLLASLVATIIGAIPAAGADISTIICWGNAKKMSKHPEEYGNGSLEGLAVSSCANNGVLGGALMTMLTLGIPGDSVTAILIGSLMMYGMQPGSQMFIYNKPFIFSIMILMVLANVVFLILGLATVKVTAKGINVKPESVWVTVSVLCIVGSFALNNNFFDVVIMLIAAIIGFLAKSTDFPPGPFILGLLLGNMLESNLRRALAISQGSLNIFVTRPVTLIIFLFILTAAIYPLVKKLFSKN